MRRNGHPTRPRSKPEAALDAAVDEAVRAQRMRAPRIVVGIDGSPEATRALVWAASEARMRSATLEIVHVDVFRHEVMELFGPDVLGSEKAILQDAADRARELEPSVVVETRLCEPPAGDALIAAGEDAALLVVGSSGAGGLKHLALGSVSADCARRARCPVVIVPAVATRVSSTEDRQTEHLADGPAPESGLDEEGGHRSV